MRTDGGFRLEGDPEISVVFGDSARFRAHVDAFFALRDDMRDTRSRFSAFARATVATLDAHRGGCPSEAVAPFYARAVAAGQEFRELGAELENHARAIQSLHDLGETASLTPDYRWKVNRARRLWKTLLVDYREMKSVLERQVATELDHRGCRRAHLRTLGENTDVDPQVAARTFDPRQPRGRRQVLPEGVAPPVTFFVDNTRCPRTMRLAVDGALLGDVAAGARGAFQAAPGRHSLCLLSSEGTGTCGDPGTLRTAFLHDGWSITVRCD